MSAINSLPRIIATGDGSHTVLSAGGLSYHSTRGAVQESQHVFIEAGFRKAVEFFGKGAPLHILEMGFGTGLNVLLTLLAAEAATPVYYTSIEKHPLEAAVWRGLNYGALLDATNAFAAIHQAPWGQWTAISAGFQLRKIADDLRTFPSSHTPTFALIYYDAFAPEEQPELWTEDIFRKLYGMMAAGGILTTYCAKGQVRRNMKAAGFSVERIPGPPGKRQMMRAVRAESSN